VELKAVSIKAIEQAELHLLEGLNYELRSHHPYGAIRVLTADIVSFLREDDNYDRSHLYESEKYGYHSPRGIHDDYSALEEKDQSASFLGERATALVHHALIYSDVHFLYEPGKVGFAAVSIVLEGEKYRGRIGPKMDRYLRKRFAHKTCEDLRSFQEAINEVICCLSNCSTIDLDRFIHGDTIGSGTEFCKMRASEVQSAFVSVAGLKAENRKRGRSELNQKHPNYSRGSKAVRVTPIPSFLHVRNLHI
jgi:hypothetical protein